jgi:protein-tyrosine phosphatase
MIKSIVDTHGHYVFDVDDGAASLEMSLEMIKAAHKQGARHIFCTSHDSAQVKRYKNNLMILQKCVEGTGLDVKLHSGMEILCEIDYLHEILEGLQSGKILPMGDSKYVLLEFSPWTDVEEIVECTLAIKRETEYEPVIAHIERYIWVREDEKIFNALKELQIPVQINAYSLVEERQEETKNFARKLLEKKLVTFIGSDAHGSDHRPVKLESGIKYIYDICDKQYADEVCYMNAEKLFV